MSYHLALTYTFISEAIRKSISNNIITKKSISEANISKNIYKNIKKNS